MYLYDSSGVFAPQIVLELGNCREQLVNNIGANIKEIRKRKK